MKKLSVEQKAKAYDEAFNVALETYQTQPMYRDWLEKMFPELKESKDERIRKAIKSVVSYNVGKNTIYDVSKEDMIAWLEKQGKQESVVVIPKFRVGDVIRPKGSMAEYTIESISGGCYHGKGWGLNISSDDDYELVEQNPAWSEEDEKQARQIERIVHDDGCTQKLQEQIADRLKSLKDRYTWKPSEEQMDALDDVISSRDIKYDVLSELWKDLKKLREE